MEKNQSFFRQEAIKSRLDRSLGSTRINIPLSFKVVSIISFGLLSILLMFIFFAEISEKISVPGYLDADKGIVTIYSEQGGTILKSALEEGQRVNKGDILFVLSHDETRDTQERIKNLNQQIKNLKQEYQLKHDHYQSMFTLFEKQYVPAASIKAIEAELLEINNKIKTIDLDVMKTKQSVYQRIKSPVTGIITNILYKQSQIVDQVKPLLQIIPRDARLIVRLYVSAQEISYFKKNKMLTVAYDAYPAQRFGIFKAIIKEINLTILTDKKEDKPIVVGHPYYKVKAELEQSTLFVSGKKTHLNYGMTLKGVIRGEKKKIWQWIVAPIYNYYGDIF